VRLDQVAHGHRWYQKLMLKVMPLMTGFGVPDVVRMLLYRNDFFGKPYNKLLNGVMRGPSEWRVGERELFAAFVSRQNHCSY
jgi:hypothetical protein